jgi:hypothetical protein
MSSFFRRPDSADDHPPFIVLSRRQAVLIGIFFLFNLLVLIVLAVMAFSTPSVQIVEKIVPQVIALPTRTLAPTPTPQPVTPTPTPISPFGGGGAIAFTLRRNGNSDIYAINAGEKQLTRLVNHPADDRAASFSPNGQEIAFASHRDGNWDIYRMDIANGITSRLTFSTTYDGAPAWLPDGKQIVFESYRAGNLDLYVMDRDGKNVKRLTTDPAPDTNPAWSPDGKSIAFSSYRNGNKDIYLLPLDSDEGEDDLANLTNTPDRDEDNPVWSPDGTQIAYTSGRPGDQLIYVNTFDLKYKNLQEADVGLFGQGSGRVVARRQGDRIHLSPRRERCLDRGEPGRLGCGARSLWRSRVHRASHMEQADHSARHRSTQSGRCALEVAAFVHGGRQPDGAWPAPLRLRADGKHQASWPDVERCR